MKFQPKDKSFYKDTAILTIGIIVAQIIPIVAYPILSRLYTPADFGILATLTSITSIITIIATLKYENSLLIVTSKRLAAEFSLFIVGISIIILFLIGFVVIIFADTITNILNAPEIKNWLWVCPISAFCLVLFNCFNEWCVRNGYFKSLSFNKIINGASIPLGKIIFAFGKLNPVGMVLGDLLGHLITGASCVVRAIKMDKEYFRKPSRMHMKYLWKRYSDCPKYVLPAQLLNKLGGELPVFFTMAYFSAEELGYYSMAQMALALPAVVVSRSVRDTFRKKANDIFAKEGNCIVFYKRILFVMAAISAVGFSLLYLIAPTLFSIVLGKKWIEAGYFCRILCPMIAINFISEVGSCMYIVAEKMNLLLIWQITYFLLTLIAMILGVFLFNSIIGTLYCLMACRSIVYLLDIYFTSHLAMKGHL